ncbi:DUF535 family protein [Pseudomonas parafulva]|uniref:VirK domain-containing protein n=1 Tax=Pseudomonas parafulva TaxID=157782 RepID=A0AAJ0LI22_9PSED|nr:DUF535 family protein [Pseudomonas parafulva]KTT16441.1 VirK domain-containing protein [Pseudomonas parafulva]
MMLVRLVSSLSTLQPGFTPRAVKSKCALAVLMVSHRHALERFMGRMRTALGPQWRQRVGDDALGMVQWPYISSGWNVAQRLDAVASHFEVVTAKAPVLLVTGRDERRVLCDLGDHSPACSLVLDRPIWFKREGELVLNLFQGELRVASLAFTLWNDGSRLTLFIGAVQGIHKGIDSETSLAIYRDLTKHFEGLRPRSLVLEALKCLARSLSVDRILAVSDGCRHHRHPYFGADTGRELAADYDAIWQDHGGQPAPCNGFFELPLVAAQRAESDIPAKKRAMYRRRQALLDSVFTRMHKALAGAAGNHELQELQGDACAGHASAVDAPPLTEGRT